LFTGKVEGFDDTEGTESIEGAELIGGVTGISGPVAGGGVKVGVIGSNEEELTGSVGTGGATGKTGVVF